MIAYSPVMLFLGKTSLLLVAIWILARTRSGSNPRWQVWSIRIGLIGLWLLAATAFTPPQLRVPVPADAVAVQSPPAAADNLPAAATIAAAPVSARPMETIVVADRLPGMIPPPMTVNDASPASPEPLATSAVAATFSWQTVAAAIWLLGVAIGMMGWAAGYLRVRRILCMASAADPVMNATATSIAQKLGISPPLLYVSSAIASPSVVGIRRPIVLLPAADEHRVDGGDLPAALAHEFAHIAGNDLRWDAFVRLTCLLGWPHPLLWRLRDQHRMACERVSDLTAAELIQDRRQYATSLMNIAARVTAQAEVGMSMARSPMILSRLKTIASDVSAVRLGRKGITAAMVATLITLAIGTTSLVAVQRAMAQAESQQESELVDPVVITGTVRDAAGNPAARATVNVMARSSHPDQSLVCDAAGEFRLTVAKDDLVNRRIILAIESEDGTQVASTNGFTLEQIQVNPIAANPIHHDIQLAAAKLARITVLDGDGNPLPNANVAATFRAVESSGLYVTDDQGMANISIVNPADIQAVVAWKDHHGLDYRTYELIRGQEHDQLNQRPEFPIDEGITLTLDGASPLAIHLTDADSQPIADVHNYVWLLQKESQPVELNLSYIFSLMSGQSNAAGVVRFDWFPSWQTTPTTVWSNKDGYMYTRTQFDPATDVGTLAVQMKQTLPIRGTVTFPDGKPASGIQVSAVGEGYAFDDFRQSTTTDEQGCYQFAAHPNYVYLLTIAGEQWAAPSQSGFALIPGQPEVVCDFTLSRSTKITGRVLDQATQEPVAGKLLYFQQYGVPLAEMDGITLPNPEGSNDWICPLFQQNAVSGEDGSFVFYAGDGDYKLFEQNTQPAVEFQINGEAEKQIDLPIEVQGQSLFTGSVVDAKTGMPIASAIAESVDTSFRYTNDWRASSSPEGIFQVKRHQAASVVLVTDATKSRGAIVNIAAEQTEARIELTELGSAHGRLLNEAGDGPAVNVALHYGVTIEDEDSGMSSNRFGKSLTTDANGRFEMTDLVPGIEYNCTLANHPDGWVLTVTNAKVAAGADLDLGELRTPQPRKAYVPPTLAERVQSSFDIAGSPLERFENAKTRIARVQQNLLIVFGDPSDQQIHQLMQIRFEDEDFGVYRDDFLFLAIPSHGEHLSAAQALADSLGLTVPIDQPGATCVVVSANGQPVASLTPTQITADAVISKPLLFAELDKYKTVPLDAHQLLADALAQAASEDKRVLVQETATWCGPCHRLSDWLQNHRQWEQDYVCVKMDHRWTGASEIMQRLRDGADGGIPWFAILDSSGNRLATSNLPDKRGTNIGFPSSEAGRSHFAEMLRSTSKRMTEAEILELANTSAD